MKLRLVKETMKTILEGDYTFYDIQRSNSTKDNPDEVSWFSVNKYLVNTPEDDEKVLKKATAYFDKLIANNGEDNIKEIEILKQTHIMR